MEPKCAYCNGCVVSGRTIGYNIVFYKGELYHNSCYTEMLNNAHSEDLRILCKRFPEINAHVLGSLIFLNDIETAKTYLNSNWCLITNGLREENGKSIGANAFDTKKAMLSWLSDIIYETMSYDFGCTVLYILNKGKVVANEGEFNIKVSL